MFTAPMVILAAALAIAVPHAPSHCRADLVGDCAPYILVTWRDHSGNEDGFIVQHWMKSGSIWTLIEARPVAANATTEGFDPLPGPHRFRVRAHNADGNSSWSNWGRINR